MSPKMNVTLPGFQETAALCYESLNNSCLRITYPQTLRLSLYFLCTAMIILTVAGNLLVIFVIIFFQNPLPASTNHLILSLALAGFLIGGFVMPYSMVHSIESCWYFGLVVCEIHTTIDVVLCNTTLWHLTFISIDRYIAIFYPLRYRTLMTNKTSMVMISASWGVALVFGLAIIISNPQVKIRGDLFEFCVGGCLSLHAKEIGLEYAVVFYFIPLFIIITAYTRIFHVAQRQVRMIQVSNKATKPSALVLPKDLKATKTLAVVVGTFFFCWTPFFMCNIIDPLIGHSIHELLYECLLWVAYLNVMLNPLIYVFFYSWFRETAKILLSKIIFMQK